MARRQTKPSCRQGLNDLQQHCIVGTSSAVWPTRSTLPWQTDNVHRQWHTRARCRKHGYNPPSWSFNALRQSSQEATCSQHPCAATGVLRDEIKFLKTSLVICKKEAISVRVRDDYASRRHSDEKKGPAILNEDKQKSAANIRSRPKATRLRHPAGLAERWERVVKSLGQFVAAEFGKIKQIECRPNGPFQFISGYALHVDLPSAKRQYACTKSHAAKYMSVNRVDTVISSSRHRPSIFDRMLRVVRGSEVALLHSFTISASLRGRRTEATTARL